MMSLLAFIYNRSITPKKGTTHSTNLGRRLGRCAPPPHVTAIEVVDTHPPPPARRLWGFNANAISKSSGSPFAAVIAGGPRAATHRSGRHRSKAKLCRPLPSWLGPLVAVSVDLNPPKDRPCRDTSS